MSVWPVAIQIRTPEGSGSSALQNLEHPGQSGRIDPRVNDDPTILPDDNHHAAPRRCGGHCGAVSATTIAGTKPVCCPSGSIGSGRKERRHLINKERDMPYRRAVDDIARGALQALKHDPELLILGPAPPPTRLNHFKPFNLSTALIAVHKDSSHHQRSPYKAALTGGRRLARYKGQ